MTGGGDREEVVTGDWRRWYQGGDGGSGNREDGEVVVTGR